MRIAFPQLLRAFAFVSLLYSVAVLAIVATTPDLRLRCLLSSGVTVSDSPAADPFRLDATEPQQVGREKGVVLTAVDPSVAGGPQPGDLMVELADRQTPTFLAFSSALYRPKGARLLPGGNLNRLASPFDLGEPHWIAEQVDQRWVRARFRPRQDDGSFGPRQTVWLPLRSAAPGRLALAIAWLGIQGVVFALAWFAYRRRPEDQANRMFLVLSATTLIAIVGGSHWWLLAARPTLAAPFLLAAILLPATLLHFAVRFPRSSGQPLTLPQRMAIYGPAGLAAAAAMLLGGLAWGLAAGVADTAIDEAQSAIVEAQVIPGEPSAAAPPIGESEAAREGLLARGIDWSLSQLRNLLLGYAFVAAGYYLACLWLFWRQARGHRHSLEHRHARWVFAAALLAAIPVAYIIAVAAVAESRLALGDAQLTLFAVSLILGVGYVAGLIGLRRVLLDELADHGLAYSVLSIGSTLLLAVTVAVASLVLSSGIGPQTGGPQTGSPLLATIALTATVLMAWWVRGRVQSLLERRFAGRRYPFDLPLVEGSEQSPAIGRPDRLAARVLAGCGEMLGVRAAAILMPGGEDSIELVGGVPADGVREFCAVATQTFARGGGAADPSAGSPLAEAVHLDPATVRELASATLLQKAPDGRPESQALLADLRAEAVQPVVVDGRWVALIALGPKESGEQFTPEDAVYLLMLAQMTGAALQSVASQQRAARLGEELRSRVEQVETQQREIRLLESEVAAFSRQDDLTAAKQPDDPVFADIRGSSPAIAAVIAGVRKVAASDATALIRGESGTGKELLAKAIHAASARAEGPLVSVHCAALSPSLMESELFGHVKGAFTDARSDKEGRFAQADGGTLFFDEVGDIPLPVQVKLLRVLQERRFEPVGSGQSQEVDVRVIAATHQNLEALIADGRFREDLYYRLNVVAVEVPPLRERPGDVLELATHFLWEFAGGRDVRFDAGAMAALESCRWPGNVRQLRNVVERALVMADGSVITRRDLPPSITAAADAAPTPIEGDSERAALAQALADAGGNKAAAAKRLGLPRSTFYSKLKKHALT